MTHTEVMEAEEERSEEETELAADDSNDNDDLMDDSDDDDDEEEEDEGAGRSRRGRRFRPTSHDGNRGSSLEVSVDNNIERAMKILKRKLIKEGLFKELKMRRYYEKPSERKKRKHKESLKKLRKEEARNKKNAQLF